MGPRLDDGPYGLRRSGALKVVEFGHISDPDKKRRRTYLARTWILNDHIGIRTGAIWRLASYVPLGFRLLLRPDTGRLDSSQSQPAALNARSFRNLKFRTQRPLS